MARRPQYVTDVIREGEMATFDKETQRWMLYRLTSKRIPGKKNPVKERTYVAEVTPLGRKDLTVINSPKLDVIHVTPYEYGISRVLEQKMPYGWAQLYPEDCEAIFLDAIRKVLPTSYLLRGKDYSLPTKGINIPLRQKVLWEHYEKLGITLEQLEPLRMIQLLCFEDKESVTAPNAAQAELLSRLGVELV